MPDNGENVFNACAELDLAADISHLYDVRQYAALGVRLTPAVIVDGKAVLSGKVPTVEELKKLLKGDAYQGRGLPRPYNGLRTPR
ncbi:MAG: thioredoxin family protein [Acidobacteriota bacterium]